MKQRTYTEEQSGVVVSRGLKNYYTSVNFNVVAVEDYWEYDSVTMTTEIPFTKENFDVVGMVVDELLKEPSVLPVRVVGEIAELFGVGKNSTSVIEAARKMIEANITAYDTSDNVNGFYVGEKKMWFDKNMRTSLMNTLQIEERAGYEETTMWWDAVSYTIPIALFEQMLSALELYAKESYNVTQSHLASAKAMTTYRALAAYDFTEDYPEMLEFDV